MNATISLNPLIYRPDYEKIQDDEGDTIQELIETLQEISDITSKDYGRAVRSVHAKPHGLIRGKLTIKRDHARQCFHSTRYCDQTHGC
jgi:hypothetical protein